MSSINGFFNISDIFTNIVESVNTTGFSPETLIYGDFGVKRIDEIQKGDNVLTINSTFKKVSKIYKNAINIEILKVSTCYSFDEIFITKEHQVYAFNEEDGIPCYININELTPLHRLSFPLQKSIIPNNDNMKDYYKFYGIIFTNGNIYEDDDTILIILKEYNNKIVSFLENFLITENINYTTIGYSFNIKLSDIKIDIIKKIYDENKCKCIDIEIFNISKHDIKEFLIGIFEGCGKYFITENRILAYQLAYLSIKSNNPRKCIKENILYKIECKSDEKYYEMYEHEDDIELNNMFENKIWFNIKDIENFYYQGYVYDLDIEENNNYTTNLGLVHNAYKQKF
jgi:intein/homing endonuclease